MYAIRQPSWNKIRIGQLTSFHSFLVLFLQERLKLAHEVTIVTIDEVDSLVVIKFVAVVKQGIEAESRQGITEAGLDLKIKTKQII